MLVIRAGCYRIAPGGERKKTIEFAVASLRR
jgi:hypothetical protein